MAKRPQPKVLETFYAVLVNDEMRDTFLKLAEARACIKDMPVADDVEEIKIIKQTTTHTLLETYKPEVVKTLTIDSFGWDEPS